MKKLASLLLALVMIMSCFSAMAEATPEAPEMIEGGSITINNAEVGHTYDAYQLLYLESYNPENEAYAYKATPAWATFINNATDYLSVDDQGYVTWKTGVAESEAANFAKAAQAYADENKITATKSVTASTANITIDGLYLGYYLIDTNLGTLCSLDTTNPSVEMQEKNEAPSIEKLVKEDDATDETLVWGESNTSEVGDTVEYKTTINAQPGAQNYILHDTMTEGLTLNPESIDIADLTKDTDYTVKFNVTHDNGTANDTTDDTVCDFEIIFEQTYLDSITTATTLTLTYNAILNDKAVISTDSNDNETYLEYGDMVNGKPEFKTPEDETKTYTYKFDLVKTTNDNKLLTGAQFELYDALTEGNKIPLVKEEDGTYRVATDAEKNAEGFVSAIIDAGVATIEGLDANTTYYLEEITAPAGYNKLAARVEVAIGESNLNATVETDTWKEGGIKVINQAGAELPSTGGMGTTILYVGGGILVLAAIVLLIVKRRANAE